MISKKGDCAKVKLPYISLTYTQIRAMIVSFEGQYDNILIKCNYHKYHIWIGRVKNLYQFNNNYFRFFFFLIVEKLSKI